MSKLVWDVIGERLYHTGVEKVALYPFNAASAPTGEPSDWKYNKGIAWNGVTEVTGNTENADANDIWADDIKYLSLRGKGTYSGSIKAYMYPDEFEECDGSKAIMASTARLFRLGQQTRIPFGLVYKTLIGNDVKGEDYGYEIHIVYGATCSPSDKTHDTINENPNAEEMSWDFTTTAPGAEYFTFGTGETAQKASPTAELVVSSLDFEDNTDALEALENYCFGTDTSGSVTGIDPQLPSPKKVYSLLTA